MPRLFDRQNYMSRLVMTGCTSTVMYSPSPSMSGFALPSMMSASPLGAEQLHLNGISIFGRLHKHDQIGAAANDLAVAFNDDIADFDARQVRRLSFHNLYHIGALRRDDPPQADVRRQAS